MSNCDSCPTKENCNSKEECMIENNPNNHIKKVIAVMSGKGGVGKSTVTTLIAKSLRKKGYRVGILDADITGPSIPRLMNVSDQKALGGEFGVIPVQSPEGIDIMSLNLLVDDEERPVIWRGPIISGTVKQFWTDVFWGELDYLIIDMPPGTGDVALTVMQFIPIHGAIVVSTPHEMVSMIVAKSINMAKTMNIPILGIVENMSYITCPDCNKKIKLFEDQDLENYLHRMDVELLGELPMCPSLANASHYDDLNDPVVKGTMDTIIHTLSIK
ncbi:MAG: Mrp/NBP35 family ATP-binding protein [Epulopiscium sp.]|nr:Mrp/NBP35 family ATP-binding protein [Candidatus Epulonipiscium sp.]